MTMTTTPARKAQALRCLYLAAVVLLFPIRSMAGPLIVDVIGNITPFGEYNANWSPAANSYRDPGNEPFVAVNPVNPQQIIVSGFAYGAPTGSLFYSTDGGTTWGARFPMTAAPGNGSAPRDQTYYYDSSGVLHGAILVGPNGGTNVYHASDADPNKDGFFGRPASVWSWNATATNSVGAGNADQPWITGKGNNVLIAYDDFSSGGLTHVAVSTDNGATFPVDNTVFLGSPSNSFTNPGLRIAMDDNNNAYAVYGQGTSSAGAGLQNVSYALNRSIDGGQTWQYTSTTPVIGGLAVDSGVSAQIGSSFGGKNELRGNTTAVAADSQGNHVYVVYGKEDGSNVDRLWLAEFHDNAGNLVERASPVAFSPVGEAAALPSVTVTADGSVAITYMTFAGGMYHEHLAISTDLGLTFTDQDIYNWDPSFITLSTPAFPSSNRALGDYDFLTSIGNTLYGVFPGQGFVNAGGYDTTGGVVPLFFTTLVPEPSSLLMAAFGFVSLVAWASRRRKR